MERKGANVESASVRDRDGERHTYAERERQRRDRERQEKAGEGFKKERGAHLSTQPQSFARSHHQTANRSCI